jgi:periplasmic protein TonB
VLAGALIAVIAGAGFSRHAHHSAVPTVPSSSNAPVAAPPDAAGPAIASESNSVPVERAPVAVPTPKPGKTTGQPGDSPVKSKAAADPVIGGEQIAVRLPGGVSSPAAPEEQPVAPPTSVSAPSVAPNLGNVVAPLPAAMPVTVSPTRVAVSQGVSQGLLIRQVKPVYPSIARESHISGTVQLRAIIARDGTVRSLNVVGGHPLLTKAAIDAVRQWRYKPYLLNGQPVEVETQISIEFKM